ncbi:TPA: hypothetical protein I7730_00495 [Vibrio vulnificus]|uniref:Uncharacterized protein n=1 Tax=Vibrio vulnificus TaxID=672 RepID=A0A8H9K6Y3_VIBVL|nr:hypothetical protein [Vibrio vulnificus]
MQNLNRSPREISAQTGIPLGTIVHRINSGRSVEEITHLGKLPPEKPPGATKLSEEMVKELYVDILSKRLTQTQLAKKYDIDKSHVTAIKNKKRWIKVTDAIDAELKSGPKRGILCS